MICGHRIQGAIYAKWVSLGGFQSPLGMPLTDELITPEYPYAHYNKFVGLHLLEAGMAWRRRDPRPHLRQVDQPRWAHGPGLPPLHRCADHP